MYQKCCALDPAKEDRSRRRLFPRANGLSEQDLADYIGARWLSGGFGSDRVRLTSIMGSQFGLSGTPRWLQPRTAFGSNAGATCRLSSNAKGLNSTLSMNEDEIIEFQAFTNDRHLKHAEICRLLRESWTALESVKKEAGTSSGNSMTTSQRARWRLAQRQLKDLKMREKQYRE